MATKCYYSVVRYVPNDLRDEAVNIGVLIQPSVVSPGRLECLASFSENLSRAACLDPTIDRTTIQQIVASVRERLQKQAQTYQLAELVSQYCDGRIQLTRPRLTITDNIQSELGQLTEQFLVEGPARGSLGLTEQRLVRDVKETLALEIPNWPKAVVQFADRKNPIVYSGRTTTHGFHACFRSPQKTDLIRCISFDLKHYTEKLDEAKILTWDYDDLRRATQHDKKIDILSVLYPPKLFGNGQLKAFHDAQRILEDKGIGTFNFSKESDRKGLANVAKERIAEAVAAG